MLIQPIRDWTAWSAGSSWERRDLVAWPAARGVPVRARVARPTDPARLGRPRTASTAARSAGDASGPMTCRSITAESSDPVTEQGLATTNCATVCYMSRPTDQPARVGVRELRQNLSVYLDRVKAGETFDVTEHGRPVARLGPRVAGPVSIIDRLIAEGRITPATVDHRTIPYPTAVPDAEGPTLSEILQAMRDEEYR